MSSERWERIGEIYHATLALPEGERGVYLLDACRGDEGLRMEVQSLLAREADASAFLETPAIELAAHALAQNHASLAGRRLGPYELQRLIGVGGMGEVYRARDTRLDRDVAIKCLPSSIASDLSARARLAREARILAALNHSHIASVYGVEEADGIVGIVLELVEGPTLADCLATLSRAEALSVADQIAEALEAAHDKGVVHRDLKPSNIKIARDGMVKVLDFGLAKVVNAEPSADDLSIDRTRTGFVAGTAAYMSPEQARGKPVDRRTDIWAFGCVVYELITRRRAFDAETSSDTLVKVLESQPDWTALPPDTPPPIRRLLRRALDKDQSKRLRDIGDARIEIADATSVRTDADAPGTAAAAPPPPRRRAIVVAGVLLAAVAVAVAYVVGAGRASDVRGTVTQLTFREGVTGKARFSPDGTTVVYGAAWDGEPFRLYTTVIGSAQSRAVDLPPADLLAVSKQGDLAVAPFRPAVDGWEPEGVLAVTALAGGAPRARYDGVVGADWSADGKTMAIARRTPSGARLEFPPGTVVHEADVVLPPRISPDGNRVCFFAPGYGVLMVADRGGTARRVAAGLGRAGHCAWSPDGREIWTESGRGMNHMNIEAFDLAGGRRVVASYPAMVQIEDIDAAGRVLLSSGPFRFSVHGGDGTGGGDRDLSVFDATRIHHLSFDGRHALLWDNSVGAGLARIFTRGMDGTPPVPMGPGASAAISPDGQWVFAVGDGKTNERIRTKLTLYPTGVGTARTIDLPIAVEPVNAAATGRTDWERRSYDVSADGSRILIPFGYAEGRRPSVHVYDLSRGAMKQITPDGVVGPAVLSPDGRRVAVSGAEQTVIYFVDDGEAQPIVGGQEPGKVVRWSQDGRALFVVEPHGAAARLFRRDLQTGERVLVREIRAAEPEGVTAFDVWVSGTGEKHAYSTLRRLTNLFVVEGLR